MANQLNFENNLISWEVMISLYPDMCKWDDLTDISVITLFIVSSIIIWKIKMDCLISECPYEHITVEF